MVRRTNGQSFVEILVAIVFLATGGMAIYTASIRNVQEAAWGAEKVLVEGLLADLVETYRAYEFCEIKSLPEVKTGGGQPTAADLEALEAQPPLSPTSLLPDPKNPGSPDQRMQDPIYRQYTETVKALDLRRLVMFKEDPPDSGKGVVTCVIAWKSRAGQQSQSVRSFAVFKKLDCL